MNWDPNDKEPAMQGLKGKTLWQKGCQVPTLSRENDLGVYSRNREASMSGAQTMKGEPGMRRGWEGKQGPDVLG